MIKKSGNAALFYHINFFVERPHAEVAELKLHVE
jgi:hypothetical protein